MDDGGNSPTRAISRLRCFVSIELSEALKDGISRATAPLKDIGADVRWVPTRNLHLTLRFLGDTALDKLPGIKSALDGVALSHNKFKLNFAGAGVFPNRRRPRVLWLGVEDGAGVMGLQRDIEAAMRLLGIQPEERPFSCHLTIGRLKSAKDIMPLICEVDALDGIEFGEIEVLEVSLMQSRLGPGGAEYDRLHASTLGT